MTARVCHCDRCGRFELCSGPAHFERWMASHDCPRRPTPPRPSVMARLRRWWTNDT